VDLRIRGESFPLLGLGPVPFLWCRCLMLPVPTVNQNSTIVVKFRRPTQSGSLPMLGSIALCWFRSGSAPVALAVLQVGNLSRPEIKSDRAVAGLFSDMATQASIGQAQRVATALKLSVEP
jgi:hypothetical protein